MTDAAQPHERRAHPRYHVRGVVALYHDGVSLSGQVENISAGGACLMLDNPLPVGALTRIDIPLPAGGVAVTAAEVVRSQPGCTGLRFLWAGTDDPNRWLLQAALGG